MSDSLYSAIMSVWNFCHPLCDGLIGIALFFISREFIVNFASELFSKMWADKAYKIMFRRRKSRVHVHKVYTVTVKGGRVRTHETTIDASSEETETVHAMGPRTVGAAAAAGRTAPQRTVHVPKARVDEVKVHAHAVTPQATLAPVGDAA